MAGLDIFIEYKLERESTISGFPNRGSLNRLYLANDTGILYQWDGNAYQQTNPSTGGTSYEPNIIVRSFADSPYVAASNDVILCNMALGDVTIELPISSSNKNGIIVVKKNGSSPNKVVINCNGAETIDGSPTANITTANNSFTVISDGANWFII